MKTHLSLLVKDLGQSIEFYSTLLNAAPLKAYSDYALFVLDDPALELALTPARSVRIDPREHFGFAVEDSSGVERAISRLTAAAFAVDIERGEQCCYATQDKVWATDPDGRRWEVYHVLEETPEDDILADCCAC